MLVLIETYDGEIVSDYAFSGFLGAMQAKWSNSDFEVKKTTVGGLSIIIPMNRDKVILPIGSIEFMKKSAEILGFEMPNPINTPESLRIWSKRKVWVSTIDKLYYPVFVKPLTDVKLFTGFVVKRRSDFDLYPELRGFNGELLCSEVISGILSEWRCYVLDGKIINCSNYSGDPLQFPDRSKIEFLLSKYYDSPIGYSLDVMVTKDDTLLVEINDGWALGNYGCDAFGYFKLLKERWIEILKMNKLL